MNKRDTWLRAALLITCVAIVGPTSCAQAPNPDDACTIGTNGQDPVIIVAGTFSPGIANELFLGNALDAAGYTHCVFELLGDTDVGELPGTASITASSSLLGNFVDKVLAWPGAQGASQVDLVGHSQGALVARHFMKAGGGHPLVGTMISLSGPNEGTEAATLVEFFLEPIFAPFGVTCEDVAPCEQMQLGSTFVNDLNAGDATPGASDYYAFYTNDDFLVWYWGSGPFGIPVVKHDNAELAGGATNVEIGDVCPLRYVSHLGMILDPVVFEMITDALSGQTIDVPLTKCLLPPLP